MSMVYLLENTTEFALLNSTVSNSTLPSYLVGKHESLHYCHADFSDAGDYDLLPDGSAFIKGYNITLNASLYALRDDFLMFCIPDGEKTNEKNVEVPLTSYLSVIGLSISMVSLLLHLIAFALVRDLRNLPGSNLAALCASLFISYLLLFLIGSENMRQNRGTCVALASMTHFFLLSSFLWMFLISYDVFRSLLRATRSLRSTNTKFNMRKFGVYCLCAYGIALLFTIFSVLADMLDILPESDRPQFHSVCWFSQQIPFLIFFAGPAILLSSINFLLFGYSAYAIHSTKLISDSEEQRSIQKARSFTYFRLSVIMGVTWIMGILANIIDKEWIWVIFVLLNALQGFFIFLCFTCTKKVKEYICHKFQNARNNSWLTRTTHNSTPSTSTQTQQKKICGE